MHYAEYTSKMRAIAGDVAQKQLENLKASGKTVEEFYSDTYEANWLNWIRNTREHADFVDEQNK